MTEDVLTLKQLSGMTQNTYLVMLPAMCRNKTLDLMQRKQPDGKDANQLYPGRVWQIEK